MTHALVQTTIYFHSIYGFALLLSLDVVVLDFKYLSTELPMHICTHYIIKLTKQVGWQYCNVAIFLY